ncbi:aspartate aminotransferase family protein [Amycolatopsis alba]|uniref:Aspartate aminotransferase family protein n=1 Tax=Amycolatopsis alba DSM 44262 TaxID=1125972 RepID=A0A229REY9_AMYAL|nr:aminotransferase class III-fold pyridoxal phosphate-dependent enzyme [Amycolatopsis alba]OXM45208.1 aspartate aminotransferase family protein [Amycolatopsis alba DSM 44262]
MTGYSGADHTAETFTLLERNLSPHRAAAYRAMGGVPAQAGGAGAEIHTYDGRVLLDCRSAGGVFDFGHRPPSITAALRDALESRDIGDWMLPSLPRGRAAAALACLLPETLPYSFFTASGSEAIEFAGKLARLATGRRGVVCAERAYHGQVGLALAMSEGPGPSAREQDVVRVPFGDIDALRAAVGEDTALVCLETIPASAGVVLPPDGYLAEVRRRCDESGALLLLDEVQSGLGRTGRIWAAEHWDVRPDLLVTGKGLSGGVYPVAACSFTEEIQRSLADDPFFHPSSFGGGELAAAVVCAVVEQVSRPGLLDQVRATAAVLRTGLAEVVGRHPSVLAEVRGLGLMLALETRDEHGGLALMRAAIDHGVLATVAHNAPSTLLVMPPLIITPAQAGAVIERLDSAARTVATGSTGPALRLPI